jgi:hemolysin III
MAHDHTLPRPLLRGWLHAATFFLAIPGVVLLIVAADTAVSRTAAGLYGGSLLLGFGVSAAYHRLAHSERARAVMQRFDHSAIFVLIAGTYVPVCLLGLPREWGIPLLIVVAALAAIGIGLKLLAFHRTNKLSYALYPIMGWVAIVATPALVQHVSTTQLVLIIAGGIAYTVGIPVLVTRRPDPWPKVFGYHEIWHVFTVVAAVLHFAAVTQFVA